MKVLYREKRSDREKAIREKNSAGEVHHKKFLKNIFCYICIKLRLLVVLDLKMKLDEEFFSEEGICYTLANIPGIRGYFLLQFSFLAFWHCRILTKAPK